MGTLGYGTQDLRIKFDDRTLLHLQLVIGAKLRRNESFFMCWRDSIDTGGGRTAVWVSAAVPLRFDYSSALPQEINRQWLETLARTADTPGGLQIVEETVQPQPPAPTRLKVPAVG